LIQTPEIFPAQTFPPEWTYLGNGDAAASQVIEVGPFIGPLQMP
jgi:hypothetical protein